jgi:anti-anti-sigma regulatory factor
VDKIYNEEEVWTSADVTKTEIVNFLEDMNSNQFRMIEQFFETMPKLQHKIKIKNPNTKIESEITLTGLADFFA